MSDRLHDHITLGFRRGCVACAQVTADLAASRHAARREHEHRRPDAEREPARPPVAMIRR